MVVRDASGAERGASHHVFVSRSSGVQVASEYRFESIVKKLSDTFRKGSINFRFTSFRQFYVSLGEEIAASCEWCNITHIEY